MDSAAVVIALAGLFTTASSPLFLSSLNARNQRDAALRDLRTSVFTDATLYAQTISTFIERITDPYFGAMLRKGRPDLLHTDAITARMRLLAPAGVTAAWLDLLSAEEALHFEVQENRPELLQGHGTAMPSDDEFVVRLGKSVAEFYDVTRAALGHPTK
ncbi:MAG: hypothetical protein WCF12_03005 [Propionicimonas sp.]